jgi:hypothetical protein
MTTSATIIDELTARGVTLQAHGDALRFSPRSAVPDDLLQRLQDHKGELLALLAGGTQGGNGYRTHATTGETGVVSPAVTQDGRPEGQDHGAGGPQDLQPQDGDAAKWQPYSTPDGRRGIVRDDVADLTIIDVPTPCSGCGGLERWQDVTGTWRCPVCSPPSPRAALLRLQAAAARTRYPRRAKR